MRYALTKRNILLISPQYWGTMRLSKHHYAVELAKRGNRVFFLNPPDATLSKHYQIEVLPDAPDLFLVNYRPLVPLALRFHVRRIFDFAFRAQLEYLRRRLNVKLDIVWCFDSNLYGTLRPFGAPKSVYHVVDQPSGAHSLLPARDADLIISVAPQILNVFDQLARPTLLLNHGVAEPFLALAERSRAALATALQPGQPIRVGYVGNLTIPSLDRQTVLRVVSQHPEVEFHFWGAYEARQSNLASGPSADTAAFVVSLSAASNARLHGPKTPSEVATAIEAMDALLVCYDIGKDANAGCNTHKLLEYFCTGKVVICNRISTYLDKRHLVQMSQRQDNGDFVELFGATLARLGELNQSELRRERLRLAVANSYAAHLDTIEAALSSLQVTSTSAAREGNAQ